ncbi:hypothetical protein F4703DRAFT_1926599 [Phycomyces blakesleeanus]
MQQLQEKKSNSHFTARREETLLQYIMFEHSEYQPWGQREATWERVTAAVNWIDSSEGDISAITAWRQYKSLMASYKRHQAHNQFQSKIYEPYSETDRLLCMLVDMEKDLKLQSEQRDAAKVAETQEKAEKEQLIQDRATNAIHLPSTSTSAPGMEKVSMSDASTMMQMLKEEVETVLDLVMDQKILSRLDEIDMKVDHVIDLLSSIHLGNGNSEVFTLEITPTGLPLEPQSDMIL